MIYKPRSLAIESAFQALAPWYNDHGAAPALPLLSVLERGEYGWVEFLAFPHHVHDDSAVNRYYRRFGALVALVHLLGGVDCHASNLIAAGEYPMLIDLEGLCHPRVHERVTRTAADAAIDMLGLSPLRTGMLPVWQGEVGEQQGVDGSALGALAGQPLRKRGWIHQFTGEMPPCFHRRCDGEATQSCVCR